jgi:DNA-binding MarR family transcriptional regulator
MPQRIKYVNMTDINLKLADPSSGDRDIIELIELLFFAYRDFISDPDEILAQSGFGRAHHRIIHFVGRHPGMTVAQLLDILRITKQSLGRVLKELIDQGYVYQLEGAEDRRQRLLYLTAQGEMLRQKLMAPQIIRLRRAFAATAPQAKSGYREVLLNLIDPDKRMAVENWLAAHGKLEQR